MMLVLFLNELSCDPEELELAQAKKRVLGLLRLLRQTRKQQRQIGLNSQLPLKDTLVDQRYTLHELLSGNEYREEWRFLKSFANRSPLSADMEQHFDLERQEVDYLHEGEPASALGWADIMDTAVVSFPDSAFQEPFIDLIRRELDESNEDAEVQDHPVSVKNIANTEHIEHHTPWLQDYAFRTLPTADHLWQKRAELFPFIRLLPRTEQDLKQLFMSGTAYPQVVRRLQELNRDIAEWREAGNAWPEFSSKATPEATTRKRFCKVMDEGEEHDFDWHLRFTGHIAGRIHFRICMREKQAIIAYLGQKLESSIT